MRAIREVVNATLAAMSSDFAGLYSRLGRPGIPPERLLRALLLQCFYSVRSERQLMERLEFDLLFRWFVGLGVDDPVWDASSFSKNRDRLLAGEVAQRFLAELLARPEVKRLLSAEHFSVDGTLIQAWASQKSFRRKDGGDEPPGPGRNGEKDFKGEKRSNATHASTTDPDARLYRKGSGQPAELCYLGHALMENRNGLIVGGVATRATGDAEPLAAIELVRASHSRSAVWMKRSALPLVFGCRPGTDVPEAEVAAGVAEVLRTVAGAVVGHDAGDLDAEAAVVGDGCPEEGGGALLPLVGQDAGEGDPRGVVDADVDELPAHAARFPLAAVAGDAVADGLEAAEDEVGVVSYNASLVALLNHYGAIPRPCRPYRAKTKGKVERPYPPLHPPETSSSAGASATSTT